MKKILLFFILIHLICSCKNGGYEIKISNKTNSRIDPLYVYPSGFKSKKVIALNAGEFKHYNIALGDFPKNDGSYILNYKLRGIWNVKSVGYFTNGSPLEKGTTILIGEDIVESQTYDY